MGFRKYVFREYSSKFLNYFKKEKGYLKSVIPYNIEIGHVGSTSIKDMKGKGIIDILIGVKDKKEILKIKNILKKEGYKSTWVRGPKDKISLEKDYGIFRKRRLHVHVTFINSTSWREYVLLRDYLRKNPKVAKKYEEIKKEAMKVSRGNGRKYQLYKKDFLDNIKKEVLIKK